MKYPDSGSLNMARQWFLVFVSVVTFAALAGADTLRPAVRVGLVTDGAWERHPEAIELFKKELLSLSDGEFHLSFPEERNLNGRWTQDGIRNALDTLLHAPDVSLVIALGSMSSQDLFKRGLIQKPVVSVFGDSRRGEPLGSGGAGKLHGLGSGANIARELDVYRTLVPFDHLTIVSDGGGGEVVPLQVREYAQKHGIRIHVAGYEPTAAKLIDKIPSVTDAVLVTSLVRMAPGEFKLFCNGLIEKRIPGFSLWGVGDVEEGLLATLTPQFRMDFLARNVAISSLAMLRGESSEALSSYLDEEENLTINGATARALGISFNWGTLGTAVVLNSEPNDGGRSLNLKMAMDEVVRENLDLKVMDKAVAVGKEDVNASRAALLPQVTLGSNATVIDSDRARVSMGQSPERAWTGSATVQQVLYSDIAWASYAAKGYAQDALVHSRESMILDAMNLAAAAYLDVLRAEAVLRIQNDNLKLTRANLERSKVRVSVGAAGPEEVYRWESEIANRQRETLVAESSVLDARSEMNRLMGRPLRARFKAGDIQEEGALPTVGDPRIYDYLDTLGKFGMLRDFLMEESLSFSPELKAINAQKLARQRLLVSSGREYWLPTVSLQGRVAEMLEKGGEGSSGGLGYPDDTNWSVGVSASLQLFSGGGKAAELRQSRQELAKVDIERRDIMKKVRQRTLIATNRIRASYPGIHLSKGAAESARRNLQLVTTAYERGVRSIIDLLDAQNLALVAEQNAVNAVYDFLADLMEVQRAVGYFFLYGGEGERNEWFAQLDAYCKG
ncbi:Outer membrane protein TolC [Desulfoluna spongiiphila]|uniref:Outer membrane protein TolC n=1 Tax=Desulfoluna spongiiphila TaxID=419481 RepID=A0A1G5AEQ6_9BACT|nr:Outer membrane protein TolC [Desulfoluna spongiiphila]